MLLIVELLIKVGRISGFLVFDFTIKLFDQSENKSKKVKNKKIRREREREREMEKGKKKPFALSHLGGEFLKLFTLSIRIFDFIQFLKAISEIQGQIIYNITVNL